MYGIYKMVDPLFPIQEENVFEGVSVAGFQPVHLLGSFINYKK